MKVSNVSKLVVLALVVVVVALALVVPIVGGACGRTTSAVTVPPRPCVRAGIACGGAPVAAMCQSGYACGGQAGGGLAAAGYECHMPERRGLRRLSS